MDANLIITLSYLSKNDSAFKHLTDEEILKYVIIFYSHQFIYDPYKKTFYNPIINFGYPSRAVVKQTTSHWESEINILIQRTTRNFSIDEVKDKIYSNHKFHFAVYKYIRLGKWAGILIGVIVAYFYNLYLGAFLGLTLIYLDYNFYNKYNVFLGKYQSSFLTATNWKQNSSSYILFTLVLFILSQTFLYGYCHNIFIVIICFFTIPLFLELYIFKSLSAAYWATEGFNFLEDSIRENKYRHT